jgi:hypothetical protein
MVPVRWQEQGQDLIEYAGVLLIVAAIVAALVMVDIPGKVVHAVGQALNDILGGGGSHGAHH